jgi:thiol-disulfide isomerase/thioredoxin
MKHFPLAIAIITIVIIVAGVFLLSKGTSQKNSNFPPQNYQYFWGTTCPHCKNVEQFLSSWEKKDAVKIDKYEVYENNTNANLLLQTGKLCNLESSQLGAVPLLVTPKGECFIGDSPIIEKLKSI